MKKIAYIVVLAIILGFSCASCNPVKPTDSQSFSKPSESISANGSSAEASSSITEEISFPRIVCKEGQWYLETGFGPEEVPGDLPWSLHYAIECENYEAFCRKLKNLEFDEYELGTMRGMMAFIYGYQENGALMIPNPDLLENRHLSGGIDEDDLGKVWWGDEHNISIYRKRMGIVLTIWESEIIYSRHYPSEDFRDEYLETLETTIIDGKTVYRKKDRPENMFYVDRTEKETVVVRWIDRENKMTHISVTVKEHGGLIYTYYGGLGLHSSWNGGYNNLSKYGEVRFSQTIAE